MHLTANNFAFQRSLHTFFAFCKKSNHPKLPSSVTSQNMIFQERGRISAFVLFAGKLLPCFDLCKTIMDPSIQHVTPYTTHTSDYPIYCYRSSYATKSCQHLSTTITRWRYKQKWVCDTANNRTLGRYAVFEIHQPNQANITRAITIYKSCSS